LFVKLKLKLKLYDLTTTLPTHYTDSACYHVF